MKRAIVTIGPQYAGKSSYCKRVMALKPALTYISRDEILTQMFGTVWLDSYSGGHYSAWERMWKTVEQAYQVLPCVPTTVLLDAWNGGRTDRQEIANRLRGCGVSHIEGWYFTTSVEQCMTWQDARDPYVPKNPGSKWAELSLSVRKSTYKGHYDFFHGQHINTEGIFDRVREIDPLKIQPAEALKQLEPV
jgi:predicted kinase